MAIVLNIPYDGTISSFPIPTEKPSPTLSTIPQELQLFIFSMLGGHDLGCLNATCQNFQSLIQDPVLQKKIVAEKFKYAITNKVDWNVSKIQLPHEVIRLDFLQEDKHPLYDKGKLILRFKDEVHELDSESPENIVNTNVFLNNVDLPERYRNLENAIFHKIFAYNFDYHNKKILLDVTQELKCKAKKRRIDISEINNPEWVLTFKFENKVKWIKIIESTLHILLENGELQTWDTKQMLVSPSETECEKPCFIYDPLQGFCFETELGFDDPMIPRPDLKPQKIIGLNSFLGATSADLFEPYFFVLNALGILNIYNWPECTPHSSMIETFGASSIKILPQAKIVLGNDLYKEIKILDFNSPKKLSWYKFLCRSVKGGIIKFALATLFVAALIYEIAKLISEIAKRILRMIDRFASSLLPRKVKILTYSVIATVAIWHTAFYLSSIAQQYFVV